SEARQIPHRRKSHQDVRQSLRRETLATARRAHRRGPRRTRLRRGPDRRAARRQSDLMNNHTEVRRVLDTVKAEGRTSLTAPEGKVVCEAYGIPVPKEGVATSAADAAKIATGVGVPVVMKIVSPQILHKTEAGGVLVGVRSKEEVAKGFATIVESARRYDPKAEIQGVQIQQMLTDGHEVIIGAVTDPAFGKLVAFGM